MFYKPFCLNTTGHRVQFSLYNGPYPEGCRPFWTGIHYKETIDYRGDFLSGLYYETSLYTPVVFTNPGLDIYLFSLVQKTSYMLKSNNSQVNFTICGLETPQGLTYTSTRQGSQTISRNMMSVLETGQRVSIQYVGHSECCRANLWGGFSVSGYMDPVVAFSVARSTSMTSPGLVRYGTVIVNTGQFNMDNSTFVAHMDGIYYFSISAGLFAHTKAELMLTVNGVDMLTLIQNSTTHNGIKTISSTTLLELQTGDEVTVHLTMGRIYSSVEQHEVSFLGFLYSLKVANSVAWLVSSINGTQTLNTPIFYDTAHIINGTEFHLSEITISISGFYYIYYSLIVDPCSQRHSREYRVYLEVGGIEKKHFYFNYMGKESTTVSGSYIFKLSAGDKVTVGNNGGCLLGYGDFYRSTAFMGFLIEETTREHFK